MVGTWLIFSLLGDRKTYHHHPPFLPQPTLLSGRLFSHAVIFSLSICSPNWMVNVFCTERRKNSVVAIYKMKCGISLKGWRPSRPVAWLCLQCLLPFYHIQHDLTIVCWFFLLRRVLQIIHRNSKWRKRKKTETPAAWAYVKRGSERRKGGQEGRKKSKTSAWQQWRQNRWDSGRGTGGTGRRYSHILLDEKRRREGWSNRNWPSLRRDNNKRLMFYLLQCRGGVGIPARKPSRVCLSLCSCAVYVCVCMCYSVSVSAINRSCLCLLCHDVLPAFSYCLCLPK